MRKLLVRLAYTMKFVTTTIRSVAQILNSAHTNTTIVRGASLSIPVTTKTQYPVSVVIGAGKNRRTPCLK